MVAAPRTIPFASSILAASSAKQKREAATIRGGCGTGKVVAENAHPPELPTFVLCGSVAVNLQRRADRGGWRILGSPAAGLLIEAGRIHDHTTVATTVHPIQILREHLLALAHDLPIDLIAATRAR